jgi:hypothetical protein
MLGLLTTYRCLLQVTNTVANLHTLQIARAPAESSQSALTSRVPVTDINSVLCKRPYWLAIIAQPNSAESESESYVTTDGQPASLSWNKAPIWGLRPDLDYCLTVAGL